MKEKRNNSNAFAPLLPAHNIIIDDSGLLGRDTALTTTSYNRRRVCVSDWRTMPAVAYS